MKMRGNGGAASAALILLGLLAPFGRAQGPFAVPAPAAADGVAAPAVALPPAEAMPGPSPTGALGGPAPAPAEPASAALPCPPAGSDAVDGAWPKKWVWGAVDAKLFPDAGRVAPNGISYDPLFSLDLDLNIWLWQSQGVYLYADSRFWGGRGGETGQTHGNIDYTRREFDMTSGVAWNYYGPLEFRAVGYDRENFNRGVSLVVPGGTTNDGAGVEQRLYLNDEYAKLGQEGFNESRAAFVSLAYFPTKSIIGGDGIQYKPGLVAHAYLTWDVPSTCCYLFGDFQQWFEEGSFQPRMLYSDVGVAFTPFQAMRALEFRLGSEFNTDWNASGSVRNMSLPYLSVRLNY